MWLFIFMRKLIIIALTISLYSCITEKKRARICATCPVISYTKDSIREVEKLVPYPVYVSDNSEFNVDSPCQRICDSVGNLKNFNIVLKDDKGHKTTLTNKNGKLNIDNVTDSLLKVIQVREKTITNLKSESKTKVIQEDCKKNHQNKFDGFLFYWFIISLIVLGFKYLPKLIGR